jgi:hypothetical protein
VRHPDDVVAQAEREQQLRGVGDEADDPHRRKDSVWHCWRRAKSTGASWRRGSTLFCSAA